MVAGQEYYFSMRRGFVQVLATVVVLVSGALAQGPPASVFAFIVVKSEKANVKIC